MTTSNYQVKVFQTDGSLETVVSYDIVQYTRRINKLNTFSITLSKATKTYDYDKFNTYDNATGNNSGTVLIYRQGTLEFRGICQKITYDSYGRMVISGYGEEVRANWKATNSLTFSAQNNTTTFTSLVGAITGLAIGTNNSFSGNPLGAIDASGMSYYEAMQHVVVDLCNFDLSVTYSDSGSSSMNSSTFAGSSTSIGTLVDDVDIKNIQRTKNLDQIVNKITVMGQNEGVNRISVTMQADNAAVDASYDMTKYGTREPGRPYIDGRITNTTNATNVVVSLLKQQKDPVEEISFDVTNVNFAFSIGDVLTIRTKQRITDGASDNFTRTVRILEATRMISGGTEQLNLMVTTSTLKTRPQDIVSYILNNQKQFTSREAVNQYSLIFTSVGINATDAFSVGTAIPASGIFNIDSGFTINANNKIHLVTDPTAAQDAATKAYVDAAVGGGGGSSQWETAGAGLIRPSTANTTIIPKTSGSIGQLASPTWDALYLTAIGISASGGNVTMATLGGSINADMPSASTTTFSVTNSGAGTSQLTVDGNLSMGGTALSAISALGSFAQLNVNGSSSEALYVAGTSKITGNAAFDGNVALGNATGDTITFNGRVNSTINPSSNNSVALGTQSTPLVWSSVNAATMIVSSTSLGFSPSRIFYVNGGIELTGNMFSNGTQGLVTGDYRTDSITTPKLGADMVAFRDTSDFTLGGGSSSTRTVTFGASFSAIPVVVVSLEIMNQTPSAATITATSFIMNANSTTSANIIVVNNSGASVTYRASFHAFLAFN